MRSWVSQACGACDQEAARPCAQHKAFGEGVAEIEHLAVWVEPHPSEPKRWRACWPPPRGSSQVRHPAEADGRLAWILGDGTGYPSKEDAEDAASDASMLWHGASLGLA